MTFFYDLNKKLKEVLDTPKSEHKQLNERDEGKHNNATTGFKALAAKAAKEYGSKAAGERVAGAVRNKMKKAGKLEETDMDESAFQAAIGKKKYGADGMKALQKAGREHASAKTMNNIRNKYDKYDESMDEGMLDSLKSGMAKAGKVAKKVGNKALDTLGHGSDEAMRKDLQKKMGLPQTGKKPMGEEYGPMEGGAPMTAKQKSFAKLAPPKDKITFADKIAGAKKEVDEMLGDVAAEAMRGALKGGQKKLDRNHNGKLDAQDFAMLRAGKGKQETDEGSDWSQLGKEYSRPKVGSVERGAKHDIEHTATGRRVTRRTDDQGISVGADDDAGASPEKRGRGRPKGTGKAMGAKGPSGTSKLMKREGEMDEVAPPGAKAERMVKGIKKSLSKDGKLSDKDKAIAYATTWKARKQGKVEEESTESRDERAEKAGRKVAKDIEYDEKVKDKIHGKKRGSEDSKAEKAGKRVTKDIEYDEKKSKKKEKTEESDASPTSGKGVQFGKGIYDSLNREIENLIAESMSINASDSTEGGKSLTITATDDDAIKLAGIVRNAGLGGGSDMDSHEHGEEPCEVCGSEDCGCGDIEEAVSENEPNWPTDDETSDDALQYSGGLNGPKSTGQTTVPVIANQGERTGVDDEELRRMMEMAGLQSELKPWERTMKEGSEDWTVDIDQRVPDSPQFSISRYEKDPTLQQYGMNKLHGLIQNYGDDEAKLADLVKRFTLPAERDREFQRMKNLINYYKQRNQASINRQVEKTAAAQAQQAQQQSQQQANTMAAAKKGISGMYEQEQVMAVEEAEELDESKCNECGMYESKCECSESVEESLARFRSLAGLKEAAKPDYVDLDKDGDREESMKKAAADKEEDKKVEESIFKMTNLWKSYKG